MVLKFPGEMGVLVRDLHLPRYSILEPRRGKYRVDKRWGIQPLVPLKHPRVGRAKQNILSEFNCRGEH